MTAEIHDFMGDIFYIFGLAVLWCLAFESPFVAIGRMVIKKNAKELSSDSLPEDRNKKRKHNKKGYVVCVYKYEGNDAPLKKLE
ncbi:hypothetical protein JTB14_021371 [Gonioctena quinquepunctata]|nr:hypothetical protein JTB14_021371 [Gonioctena quinquepunctata]